MKGGYQVRESRDRAGCDIDAPAPAMNHPMAFSQSEDELKGDRARAQGADQHVAECPDRINHNYSADSGVHTDPKAIEHTKEANVARPARLEVPLL
jgi:hypothetical protein